MKKICVYGSLRFGHGNHRALLMNSKQIKTEVVNIPFRMISLGGFPGLVPSEKKHNITIEIYEVDDSTYKRVESLEGYPHFYQKAIIPTSEGELEIYVLLDERFQEDHRTVESGDWNEYYKPRYV